jgi:hypothetical protein
VSRAKKKKIFESTGTFFEGNKNVPSGEGKGEKAKIECALEYL